MDELNKVKLQNILPESIASDAVVKNICIAVDDKLRTVSEQAELVLLLPRLDSLPEWVVDELAWQYHVDFYDYSASLDKKRSLVRQAIAWHKHKGTPAAVEDVCTAVFKTATVYENWEYGGEPYHFQVRLIEEGIPNQAVIENLQRAINQTKNTRSWLDGLSFYREVFGRVYLGGIMTQHKSIAIYPAKFPAQKAAHNKYIGAGTWYHRKVEIV